MRQIISRLAAAISLCMIAVIAMIVANSAKLYELQGRLIVNAADMRPPAFIDEIRDEALRRAKLYNELIKANFLMDGMVVDRDLYGEAHSVCDSLLFSALRYVSLVKLGWIDDAQEAWQAIEASQSDGRWQRHPQCEHMLSRDMILGVLAALTQTPPGARTHLINLLQHIGRSRGFVGDGPFHVSYLTPGVAELLRHLADLYEVDKQLLPRAVRYGFSTLEVNALGARAGYRSHLNALIIWTEMETSRLRRTLGQDELALRSLPAVVERILSSLIGGLLSSQRQHWAAEQLIRVDDENLFFQYLRLRASGALTDASRGKLLQHLISMPQFPNGRLPNVCDRAADYLWQRASNEYLPEPERPCDRFFNGTDFLWMAALLLEDELINAND